MYYARFGQCNRGIVFFLNVFCNVRFDRINPNESSCCDGIHNISLAIQRVKNFMFYNFNLLKKKTMLLLRFIVSNLIGIALLYLIFNTGIWKRNTIVEPYVSKIQSLITRMMYTTNGRVLERGCAWRYSNGNVCLFKNPLQPPPCNQTNNTSPPPTTVQPLTVDNNLPYPVQFLSCPNPNSVLDMCSNSQTIDTGNNITITNPQPFSYFITNVYRPIFIVADYLFSNRGILTFRASYNLSNSQYMHVLRTENVSEVLLTTSTVTPLLPQPTAFVYINNFLNNIQVTIECNEDDLFINTFTVVIEQNNAQNISCNGAGSSTSPPPGSAQNQAFIERIRIVSTRNFQLKLTNTDLLGAFVGNEVSYYDPIDTRYVWESDRASMQWGYPSQIAVEAV